MTTVKQQQLKNLKPFQKGTIANPKGRPKGIPNSSTVAKRWLAITKRMQNPLSEKGVETLTALDRIVIKQIEKALGGDTAAFNSVLDRLEGKPTQKNEDEIIIKDFKVGYGPEVPV